MRAKIESVNVSLSPPDFAEERREKIAQLVQEQGRVRIADLVGPLGVTEPTIRRDLTELERQRVLRRTHGGAIALTPHPERAFDDRGMMHRDAKQRIATACLAEIGQGDSVFLDSGTTIQAIADGLDQPGVNVLTNAVGVARALANRGEVRHTLLGGQLRPLGGSLVGPVTLDTLKNFTVNLAFIGASGITSFGISVADVAEGQVKSAVIDMARRVIVPVDSSKIGATDFYRVAGLERVDLVVTDTPNDDLARWCERHGTALRIAEG